MGVPPDARHHSVIGTRIVNVTSGVSRVTPTPSATFKVR
jgi:hypothetical protein